MEPTRIVSLRAGRVRELARPAWDRHAGRTWRTAYLKAEVEGPVRVGPLGLEGDEQADRAVHGGVQMAVLAYAEAHYPAWRAELALPEMGPGGFGENLTVSGADERGVCLGDRYRAGTAELEVSQPRGPCASISRIWDRETLLERVVETRRSGWYLRVLREGSLARGDALERLARPHPEWTIDRVLAVRYAKRPDPADLRALADCPALSPEWRARFAHLAGE